MLRTCNEFGTFVDVSIQEFKLHLAKYVNLVRLGQVVTLTAHRKAVARLSGIPATEHDGIAKLVTTGQTAWSSGKKPKGASLHLTTGGSSLAEMILEDRR
jgi:antitoxin (DNA-binding transcriptional repressor) of toxin-antitoxin stability system